MEGLSSFRHHKVGKKSELTLVWLPEDPEEAPIEQVREIQHTYDYGHFACVSACARAHVLFAFFKFSGISAENFFFLFLVSSSDYFNLHTGEGAASSRRRTHEIQRGSQKARRKQERLRSETAE